MAISISFSAPPARKVFRGAEPRAVALVAEKALWQSIDRGVRVDVKVDCDDATLRQRLERYFSDLQRDEFAFRAQARI